MNTRNRSARPPGVAACALALAGFALGGPVIAGEGGHGAHDGKESAAGHSHERAEMHGGSVTMTPQHHFETVFTAAGARLWVYDATQAIVANPKGAKATLTLQPKQGEPVRLAMTYVGPDSSSGVAQGHFTAAHDLSAVAKGAMKAVFKVEGLAKEPLEFRTPVVVGEQTVYACPMHPDVTAADPVRCSKCGMALVKGSPSGKKTDDDGDDDHGPGDGHEGHSH